MRMKLIGLGLLIGAILVVLGVAGISGCTATSGTAHQVLMMDNRYEPAEFSAPPGTTITWLNRSSRVHTVTADTANPLTGGPNSDATMPNGIQAQQSYSWTVPASAAPGTRWYFHDRYLGHEGNGRTIGSGMAGSVTVM